MKDGMFLLAQQQKWKREALKKQGSKPLWERNVRGSLTDRPIELVDRRIEKRHRRESGGQMREEKQSDRSQFHEL